ncbi:MAG: glycerol-3-phosphate 1-O-acyltransferase PlsY [Acidobacteriota bacterium]
MSDGWIVGGAYVLGAIPFSFLVVRLLVGRDLRSVGSGNVGATNALRAGGKAAGVLALLLDAAKGVVAVLVARRLGAPAEIVAAAAAAAVVGHVFPIFLGFHGGKGVATAAGAMGSLEPVAFLATLVVFALVVGTSRYVSLGSIVAVALFPAFVAGFSWLGWTAPAPRPLLLGSAAIALLIFLRHLSNIRRLLAGRELRLGAPVAGAPEGGGAQ